MTIATGTVLDGRYELGPLLGRGGMGRVFRAHDQRLGRDVAVKVLDGALAADQHLLARFEREARAAASLHHPGIVGVFDRGEHDGAHYIVMEFVDGPSLADLLRTEGGLDPDRAVSLGVAVAEALGLAHRSGLVHRDVKPSNVLVTPDGALKVTDFGIARRASDPTLTATDSVLGSIPYVAPEQVRGEPATPASDVYALGCLVYALLTGQPPFRGEVEVSVLHRHLTEPPTPPSELRDDVSVEVDRAVLAMLEKDPADRPADGDEAAELLRRAGGGDADPGVPALVPAVVLERTQALRAVPQDATRVLEPGAPATRVLAADASSDDDPPIRWGRRAAAVALLAALVVLAAAFGDRVTAGLGDDGTPQETADPAATPPASVAPSPSAPPSPSPSPSPSPETLQDVLDRIGRLVTTGRGTSLSNEASDKLTERLFEVARAVDERDWSEAVKKISQLRQEVGRRAEKDEVTAAQATLLLAAVDQLEQLLPAPEEDEDDD